MKKYLRLTLIGLLVILVLMQFIRPERNLSNVQTNDIHGKYTVPADVDAILKTACNDCHSNSTVYPWYANIQPVAWWLANHVEEGKQHLNFSEFTNLKIAVQNHKFEEVVEMVEAGEMPLNSYTVIHRDAVLDPQKQQKIVDWAHAMMDTLKANYPADSLVLKRRG